MIRRSILSCAVVIAALLALAAPALAGGWAVVTLDTLPKEVHAGQPLHLGFVIRQHGKTLVNTDWDGHPLKPVLTARKKTTTSGSQGGNLVMVAAPSSSEGKGEETIRAEARQEGAKGHFVVDVTFPSDGTWEWEISAPPFAIQRLPNGDDGSTALFAPLTVLPAAAAPAAQAAAPEAAPSQAEPNVLGLSPVALRWGGALLLLAALGVILAGQLRKGSAGGRRGTQVG